MPRTWTLGEGITVSDLVRQATTSVGTRTRLQDHYATRRGVGHPRVNRVNTLSTGSNGKITSCTETLGGKVSHTYTVTGVTVESAYRKLTGTVTGGRIVTLVIQNK